MNMPLISVRDATFLFLFKYIMAVIIKLSDFVEKLLLVVTFVSL